MPNCDDVCDRKKWDLVWFSVFHLPRWYRYRYTYTYLKNSIAILEYTCTYTCTHLTLWMYCWVCVPARVEACWVRLDSVQRGIQHVHSLQCYSMRGCCPGKEKERLCIYVPLTESNTLQCLLGSLLSAAKSQNGLWHFDWCTVLVGDSIPRESQQWTSKTMDEKKKQKKTASNKALGFKWDCEISTGRALEISQSLLRLRVCILLVFCKRIGPSSPFFVDFGPGFLEKRRNQIPTRYFRKRALGPRNHQNQGLNSCFWKF